MPPALQYKSYPETLAFQAYIIHCPLKYRLDLFKHLATPIRLLIQRLMSPGPQTALISAQFSFSSWFTAAAPLDPAHSTLNMKLSPYFLNSYPSTPHRKDRVLLLIQGNSKGRLHHSVIQEMI